MKMKVFLCLVVNLAVVSAAKIIQAETVDIDAEESVEAKKELLYDDILEPPSQRSTIIGSNGNLWTSPVPYVLDKSLDLNAKGVIMRAYDQFRLKTCIDFKQWDAEEYYITVQKLMGCYSYIGRVFPNGQVLSIGSGCDYIATVEHEFLHALGFNHEQSRYDRDDYVTIVWDNILKGRENNFDKVSSDESTTHGTPYDYMSVMHYDNNAFTNGNGSTIITKDPKFEDVIGQRLEMSYYDAQELNSLYKCSSTIAFKMYCGFSDETMCKMQHCSQGNNSWELVTQVPGGPNSDHTTLPIGGKNYGGELGYFMHVSTATGQEGDTAQLETQRMTPKRDCHIQCLQFYYYHSGDESDVLNIWIREFENEWDSTGTRRLMGQITGSQTSHWQLHHVSLNASKSFQVVFEAQKGSGLSTGGFSVDDINLYETQCPHLTLQIDDFERVLNTSDSGSRIYSSRQYSSEGYAYRFSVKLSETYIGVFVQLLSGDYDDQLEWPSLRKQLTFQMLDQNPTIQQQMAKRWSFTTNENQVYSGSSLWENPRVNGNQVFVDQNNQPVYGGLLYGVGSFATLKEMKTREFLKGGSAIFTLDFQDLTPLVSENTLPCPKVRPLSFTHQPAMENVPPCLRTSPTTVPTQPTTIPTSTQPNPATTDNSIFNFSPRMMPPVVLIVMLMLMLLVPQYA